MDQKFACVRSPTISTFPSEICILVLDDNSTCSSIVAKILQKRTYEVQHFETITDAFNALWEREDRLELVLTSVNMPDIEGFDFLKHIGKELILPIISMSTDDKVKKLLGDLKCGTTVYIVKNVTVLDVENLRNYLFAKKIDKGVEVELEGSDPRASQPKNAVGEISKGHREFNTKEPEQQSAQNEVDDSTTLKKPRVVWTDNLHAKFLEVVEQLGVERACPSKILERMNVPGLTRYNVASHLQKHRNNLKRVQEGKRSTRSKHRFNFTEGWSDQTLQKFGLSQAKSRYPAPLQQGSSGTFSMPTFDNTRSLNPEAAIDASISNLSRGNPLLLSNLQLPCVGHAPSLSAVPQNTTFSSGTKHAQNTVDSTLAAQVGSTQFPGGDKNNKHIDSSNNGGQHTKSPYVGSKKSSKGELIEFGQVGVSNNNDKIGRNISLAMALDSYYGNSNQSPLTYLNSIIPQQQSSLPQHHPLQLQEEKPKTSSTNINIDLPWSVLATNLSTDPQDSNSDEDSFDEAIKSFTLATNRSGSGLGFQHIRNKLTSFGDLS